MLIALVWVITSLLIGLSGARRRYGFSGFFLISLILSPLVGLFLLLMTDPIPRGQSNR